MVVDFIEVLLNSPAELAHFGGRGVGRVVVFSPGRYEVSHRKKRKKIDNNWVYTFQ